MCQSIVLDSCYFYTCAFLSVFVISCISNQYCCFPCGESGIVQIQGNIHWTGGNVLYQTGNGSQSVKLPALDGELTIKDSKLTLLVDNSRLPVLSIHLQRDGWVELRFNARLLALADLPVPQGTNPDDLVLTVEEKIL